MSTINVLDSTGITVALEKPLVPGRAAAVSSRPVALATEDKAAVDAILAKIIGAPATEAKQDAIITALATNHTDELQLHLDIATTLLAKEEAIRALLAGTLAVGTHAVTQSGTFTVQPGNTPNTVAWKVDGSAVTQPVSIAAGVAVTGTFWQATQPVSLATAPALVAGSAIIGKVGVDQTTPGTTNAVSLAQVGSTTVASGNGVVSAGVQRVAIASDNTAFSVNAIQSGTWNVTVNAALPAGAALIGKVGIDQTTPGTTNAVALTSPAGTRVETTVASGGTAANLFSTTPVNGFEVVNTHATETLYIRENGTATVAANSFNIPIAPLDSYVTPPGYKPTGDVSYIAATTGHAVIGRRW